MSFRKHLTLCFLLFSQFASAGPPPGSGSSPTMKAAWDADKDSFILTYKTDDEAHEWTVPPTELYKLLEESFAQETGLRSTLEGVSASKNRHGVGLTDGDAVNAILDKMRDKAAAAFVPSSNVIHTIASKNRILGDESKTVEVGCDTFQVPVKDSPLSATKHVFSFRPISGPADKPTKGDWYSMAWTDLVRELPRHDGKAAKVEDFRQWLCNTKGLTELENEDRKAVLTAVVAIMDKRKTNNKLAEVDRRAVRDIFIAAGGKRRATSKLTIGRTRLKRPTPPRDNGAVYRQIIKPKGSQ